MVAIPLLLLLGGNPPPGLVTPVPSGGARPGWGKAVASMATVVCGVGEAQRAEAEHELC